MPTAVLRRYTPPTCTLEIAATGSALSRWTDRTVLKNVRFNLSFDDPKLLPEEQITVSGSRTQLEALCQTVAAYVHQLLDAAPDQILWEPALRSARHDGSVGEAVPAGILAELPAGIAADRLIAEPPLPGETNRIALQPRGLLSHELQLGNLATAESGSIVRLTTLQLFDLANALEDYQAEALSLPALERPWLKLPQGSLKIAASAILALGVTGMLGKFVVDLSRPTVQTASTSAPAEREVNSELSQELFPTLSPPPNSTTPPLTIQPLPPPPPNGAAQPNSPGLPPVGTTQPPAVAPQPPAAIPQPQAPATLPNADAPSITVIPNPDGAAPTAAPPAPSASSNPAEPPRLAGVEPDPSSSALRAGQSSTFDSAESNSAESNSAESNSAASSATNSTAFDAIPQVAEIRGYFQERWQPPAELTQTLEYRLLLNADGSLQRIVPLGQASANFIDRTNMPLMGEPFVSATSDGSMPQIRLVLKPNGSVQSFLEYAN